MPVQVYKTYVLVVLLRPYLIYRQLNDCSNIISKSKLEVGLTFREGVVLANVAAGQRHDLQLRQSLACGLRQRKQVSNLENLDVDEIPTLLRGSFGRPVEKTHHKIHQQLLNKFPHLLQHVHQFFTHRNIILIQNVFVKR